MKDFKTFIKELDGHYIKKVPPFHRVTRRAKKSALKLYKYKTFFSYNEKTGPYKEGHIVLAFNEEDKYLDVICFTNGDMIFQYGLEKNPTVYDHYKYVHSFLGFHVGLKSEIEEAVRWFQEG